MAFRFSLQALLKLTKERLDALREEISQLEGMLKDQRRKIEELRAQRERGLLQLRDRACAEWDPKEMSYLEGYLEALVERIERENFKLMELKEELSAKQARALMLLQRMKLLEKACEKQYSEFLRTLRRKELNGLDLHNLEVKFPFPSE